MDQNVMETPHQLDQVLANVRAIGPKLRERAVTAEHERRLSRETVDDVAGVSK